MPLGSPKRRGFPADLPKGPKGYEWSKGHELALSLA